MRNIKKGKLPRRIRDLAYVERASSRTRPRNQTPACASTSGSFKTSTSASRSELASKTRNSFITEPPGHMAMRAMLQISWRSGGALLPPLAGRELRWRLLRVEGPGETQFRAPRGEVFAAEAVIEAGRRELHAAGGEIAEAAFDTPSHAFRHEVIGTEHERS